MEPYTIGKEKKRKTNAQVWNIKKYIFTITHFKELQKVMSYYNIKNSR